VFLGFQEGRVPMHPNAIVPEIQQLCGVNDRLDSLPEQPSQVSGKSAVAEQSQVRVAKIALPPSTSPSDELLRRIATLLFILVAGLLTVFGYYASSICITVVLAGFLAILFDPLVVKLEKLHLPRSVAAAGIVLAGMGS
jgi:hypothetical protein